MYVGKRIKSILSIILICGLLVVSVPSRAIAAGPLMLVPALSPAMKYAIGAGIVAGGLYAANSDSLNYVIEDYWTKASDYVKHQWQSAVNYGTGIGIILLNDSLKNSVNEYLNYFFESGINNVVVDGGMEVIVNSPDVAIPSGQNIQKIILSDGRYAVAWLNSYSDKYFLPGFRLYSTDGTFVFHYHQSRKVAKNDLAAYGLCVLWTGSYYRLCSWYRTYSRPDLIYDVHAIEPEAVAVTGETTSEIPIVFEYEFYGDAAGFGNATEGRPDVKVPCPPLPAAEWPDQWVDDLLGEMNRTGNPTLDDETFVEECEREWDWYWDDNVAYIYRVPHGDPPRDPDDEPIRIPIPPPPQPEIPYPQPDPIPQPADPCPYCPPNPYPSPDGDPCPNPYCPNQPNPVPVPVPQPATPAEPCPYCPPNPYPSPNGEPCPNPYCPNQPNPQPVPKPPPDIQPYYDDPEINWEPLRRSLYELTEKFPFSLPWDLMRGVQSMEANQWDRKIRVVIGDEFWPNFEIDLTMFDRLARISRVIMLVIFDLGLIFATRKLMGGDV
jgi:hypothetical protein